ncbi:MAG TPA: FAD-dependent oxidoreductase [Conexibacter sp.]|nr:FAD-dependent oxidoreductase [Conexibacter sp.]
MALRVLVLGAGFGGLELCTTLSDALGDEVEVTLVDKADAFVFGYSKLDVMFGRTTLDAVRLPYRDVVKPGVRFVQETIVAIDPEARRVETDATVHEADVLVVALGADYDFDATLGLAEADEFYSVEGAMRLSETLPEFAGGRVVIGVCGAPFKCPPAPSECALLLHDQLTARGLRDDCELTFAIPFDTPVPPSPDTSAALVEAFAAREIRFVPGNPVASLDPARKVAVLAGDGGELPYDLFLGVPKHRAPDVVITSGMTVDGYIPVDSATLATRYPGVYAVGDVATVGVPKAGVFAEGAARVVAEQLIARVRGADDADGYAGRGSCYIEFGAGRVGRVDVDFLGGPRPTGTFQAPSDALVAEKVEFGASRRARWFGR